MFLNDSDDVLISHRCGARPEDVEARMKVEIRDIGIPPRPSILAEIEQETAKDEPDFINLARILSRDVGLSASLIKVANSSYFSPGKPVPTVQEAMQVLGLKIVVNTIAGLALQQVFKNVPNLDQFWEASAANAQAANWLARKLGQKFGIRPEDAYTFALFRDCGIPVLLIPFPEYQATLDAAEAEPELPFTKVEEQALGINHAQVGADMARNWKMPEETCLAIAYHHGCNPLDSSLHKLPERAMALIAFSHLAEYLVHRQSGRQPGMAWQKHGVACLACLSIEQEILDALAEDYSARYASA